MKKIYLFAIISMGLSLLMGCSSKTNKPVTPPEQEKEVIISLDKNELELYVNQSELLTATTENYEGEIDWKSSNSTVAEVSTTGLVTGNSAGECVIIAKAGDVQATSKITVKDNHFEIILNSSDVLIDKNKTFQIRATLIYREQTVDNVSFAYSNYNSEIITVDETGLITGKGYGQTEIKVSTVYSNLTFDKTIIVSVQSGDTISMENSNVTIFKKTNEGVFGSTQLNAIVRDVDNNIVESPTLSWHSNDNAVVTVDSTGFVTAVSKGATSVVAKYISADGCEHSCFANIVVDLLDKQSGLVFDIELLEGDTNTLVFTGAGTISGLTINGKEVSKADYTINGETLTINNSVFEELVPGNEYSLVVESDYKFIAKIILYSQMITTKEELFDFLKSNAAAQNSESNKKSYEGYFALGNDIDCEGTTFVDYGTEETPGKIAGLPNRNTQNNENGFRGVFNGRGYAIKNFKVSSSNAGGLFGEVGNGGVVKNTRFEYAANTKFTGKGAIVLYNLLSGATLSNCLIRIHSIGDYSSYDYMALMDINNQGNAVENLIVYDDDINIDYSYMFVRMGTKNSIKRCYAVSKAAFAHNVKVEDATLEMGVYSSLINLYENEASNLPSLEFENLYFKWLGHDFECAQEETDFSIYVEKNSENDTSIDISELNISNVKSISFDSNQIQFTQNGNELILNGNQFKDFDVGEKKLTITTDKQLVFCKLYICSDIITTKEELYSMLLANTEAQNNADIKTFSGYYVLGNSINCQGDVLDGYTRSVEGRMNILSEVNNSGWNTGFAGTFDGRGYEISNFELCWRSNISLFGAIHNGDGCVMNTVFHYKEDTQFKGYGGLIGHSVAGIIKNNVIILTSMMDNAANSPTANAVLSTTLSVTQNLIIYKDGTNISNASLFARSGRGTGDASNTSIRYNVAITTASFAKLVANSAGDFVSVNTILNSMTSITELKETENYTYLNDFVSVKDGHYYWMGTTLIGG